MDRIKKMSFLKMNCMLLKTLTVCHQMRIYDVLLFIFSSVVHQQVLGGSGKEEKKLAL